MSTTAPATLNHIRRGTGEPLVLIHGLGSFSGVWEPVLDALAREHEVIALDLPGFGGSAPLADGATPTVAALTDAVAGFLEEIGVERPLVVGNSLGGWIALELAKREVPRAVVAISPAGFWATPGAVWLRAQFGITSFLVRRLPGLVARASATPTGRRLLGSVFYGNPEKVPTDDALAAARNYESSPGLDPTLVAMSHDHFADGASVRGPVTIVWGDHDRLLFPRQALRALDQIPNARYVQLKDAGHVPMWDATDEIVRLLLDA